MKRLLLLTAALLIVPNTALAQAEPEDPPVVIQKPARGELPEDVDKSKIRVFINGVQVENPFAATGDIQDYPVNIRIEFYQAPIELLLHAATFTGTMRYPETYPNLRRTITLFNPERFDFTPELGLYFHTGNQPFEIRGDEPVYSAEISNTSDDPLSPGYLGDLRQMGYLFDFYPVHFKTPGLFTGTLVYQVNVCGGEGILCDAP